MGNLFEERAEVGAAFSPIRALGIVWGVRAVRPDAGEPNDPAAALVSAMGGKRTLTHPLTFVHTLTLASAGEGDAERSSRSRSRGHTAHWRV